MTGMNWTNTDNDQTYVPAGIHWQVSCERGTFCLSESNTNFGLPFKLTSSQKLMLILISAQVGQATSITNCDFSMSVSTDTQSATAVGIYMENGSGGFVSDLTFTGGYVSVLVMVTYQPKYSKLLSIQEYRISCGQPAVHSL